MLLLLIACASEPRSWQDCDALSGVARDDCQGRLFPKAFCDDPEAAAALVETHVSEPAVRDLIWHQVTLEVDPHTARWCTRIQDAAVRSRCESIVKRPHLQRGVAPLCGGAPSAPGGPPPTSAQGGVPAPGPLPGAPPPEGR